MGLIFPPATSCDGKYPFPSKSVAARAAKVSRARGLAAYHCTHCQHWHIGHPVKLPGRPKQPPPAIELEA